MMINSDAAMAVAFFGAAASLAWAAAFAWARWLAHRYDAPPPPATSLPAAAVARLERLEAGLDVLTLELERLAEGSATRRGYWRSACPKSSHPGARPPEPGRVVTPH